ncbi:MAG: (2Fe-2S)-binding protein [Deltaproteobacteria bacterium]|jgi:aerobic-type carbon monoxide dehydrogenase small subunit (CoxS/CutS family)|nr:(2Fe-2S)-binding protein [Deltaproteobacteria bacterium]
MIKVSLTVNGKKHEKETAPDTSLLDFLRSIGVKSVKKGCGKGECGACGVIMDGVYCKSCIVLAIQANGTEIKTVESLGNAQNPHPLQTSFVDEGAVQCGYCIPSMLLAAKNMLDKNPEPDEKEIRKSLDGNLCRCTGYVKQIAAVKKAAKIMRENKNDQ